MKKEIRLFGNKDSYPQKKTMNLYQKERTANSPSVLILTALGLALFVFAFTRIGVLDRLDTVRKLRSSVREDQTRLEEYQDKLKDYAEIEEKYRRYTDTYLTEEEAGLVDRSELLEIIEKQVMTVGECPSITIRGNYVSLIVKVSSLEEVATIKEKLESSGKAKDVTVYTADWSGTDESDEPETLIMDDERQLGVQTSICFTAVSGEEAQG